jgi:hypothetical protein
MVMRRLSVLLATGVLVVLVALTLSACTGGGQENKSPGSSEPRATNLHGKILFPRERGKYEDETVFTAAADGTHERLISDFGGQCCPRFSPHRTKILWSALAPDGERITTAIVRADGSHRQLIPLHDPGVGSTEPFQEDRLIEGSPVSPSSRRPLFLLSVLSVFEPVLVLLDVGHGGALQRQGVS